jgi:hypothetical protein
MKRKIFTLLACASFVVAGAAELTIKQMTAPTLDADPSDWGDGWVTMSLTNAASTTSDMSAKFQFGYDMQKAYIILEINDATPNSDATAIPNSYERDCNEMFFSMTGDTMKKYHEGCWQLRMQRSPETKDAVDGNNGKIGGGDMWNLDTMKHDAGFNAVSSGTTNPYYIEWAIPWNALTWQLRSDSTAAWDFKTFTWDLAVADNTTGAGNGRTQQVYWNNNTDGQWNNTSCFGKVTLTDKVNVNNMSAANSNIRIRPSYIQFTNTSDVNVYDITGKLVLKASRVNQISTAALRSGVYVVSTGSESKKFIR